MTVREYGYEYDAVRDEELFRESKGKTAHGSLWGSLCLRSGRDALKIIANEHSGCAVFMPALSCDSMVLPFETYGCKVNFYRLREDYSADISHIDDLLAGSSSEAVFLYMDYFGKRSVSDEELNGLKKRNPKLVFVEDRTHNLIREQYHKFVPDYTIASLRKWLAVPDGGVFIAERNIRGTEFSNDTEFYTRRLSAQCMRNEFFRTGDQSVKTEYRKIFSVVSDIIDSDRLPALMSEYSYTMALRADWDGIRKTRSENAKVLIDILSDNPFVKLIQDKTGYSDLYVPFTVADRNAVQEKLSPMGIFNTVIWPLSDEQKDICRIAKFTEEHMLAAPCDQRYGMDDMKYIGNKIDTVIRQIYG